MLLEWTAALELFARGQVKAVMPIIACDEDGTEFPWDLPKARGAGIAVFSHRLA